MTALTRPIRRLLGRGVPTVRAAAVASAADADRRTRSADAGRSARSPSTSPESDPLLAYLQTAPGPVELARLELDSPAVTALREAGVALVVPLVSQGELIGTLNLGPRLSEQDYSTDDRRLLTTLAAQAAPGHPRRPARPRAGPRGRRARAPRAGDARRDAHPAAVPAARAAEPAAVADRRVLRPGARGRRRLLRLHRDARRPDRDRRRRRDRQGRPGRAGHGPDPLHPARRGEPQRFAGRDPRPRERAARPGDAGPDVRDLPVRDPRPGDRPDRPGQRRPQPAVHPHRRRRHRAARDRACRSASCPTSRYEETEGVIAPGSNVLLYSDGLVEAHDPDAADVRLPAPARGDDRSTTPAASCSIDCSTRSTRSPAPTGSRRTTSRSSPCGGRPACPTTPARRRLRPLTTAFSIPGEEGNERLAMDRVAAAVADLGLAPARLERLKTAVSEATMNAIEYGSQGRAGRPGRRRGRGHARRRRRPDHRPGPVGRRPRRRRGARHRAEARRRPEAARLGPLPDQEHGGFDGRDHATGRPRR